ncbi:MAG: amidohydrolase family protein [Planctomycetes bacterium]|nr:amidohydrolase family protein [Planctomycetota bacterium]
MNYTKTEKKLIEAMEQMKIIDAHEHLPPEHVRTDARVDVLVLFAHYTKTDLVTAGLAAKDYEKVVDCEQPLKERWKLFRPFLKEIRYGSYARPAFIAAKEFYGCGDITDKTYMKITERMRDMNKPGIYKKVLRKKCRILTALTQAGRTDYDTKLLTPLMPLDTHARPGSADGVDQKADALGMKVASLDDYLAMVRTALEKLKTERVVGLKTRAQDTSNPDRKEAEELFTKMMDGDANAGNAKPLCDFLKHQLFELCADLDLVVAVHAGMWGDFRQIDSEHMINVFPLHPRTRFDLYHMGMPSVRRTGVIGKNNPNVWLNLCWTHIISPQMTLSALDEYMDMVPMNKIIGFGGDYGRPVEKVYGHLVMARENIATVLGRRVDRGLMGLKEARAIAHKWLYTNPKELYRLDV